MSLNVSSVAHFVSSLMSIKCILLISAANVFNRKVKRIKLPQKSTTEGNICFSFLRCVGSFFFRVSVLNWVFDGFRRFAFCSDEEAAAVEWKISNFYVAAAPINGGTVET